MAAHYYSLVAGGYPGCQGEIGFCLLLSKVSLLTPPTSGWADVSEHNRNANCLPVHVCFYFLPLWSVLSHYSSTSPSHPCGCLNRKVIQSIVRATSTGQKEVWRWGSVRNHRECFCWCTEGDCRAEIGLWAEPAQEHTRASVYATVSFLTWNLTYLKQHLFILNY